MVVRWNVDDCADSQTVGAIQEKIGTDVAHTQKPKHWSTERKSTAVLPERRVVQNEVHAVSLDTAAP